MSVIPAARTVLFVTAEAGPLIKVGGLADVAAALPPAMATIGVQMDVALPLHGPIRAQAARGDLTLEPVTGVPEFRLHDQLAGYFRTTLPNGVTVWLIGNNAFFDRPHPYTDANDVPWPDSLERYAFFQLATLHLVAWLRREGIQQYDVIHANDHQTALIPLYLQELRIGDACGHPPVVFTIHNIGYQGVYPEPLGGSMDGPTLERLTGLPAWLYYPTSPLEYWGRLNCLKAAIETADALTTVSPTYAREIQEDADLAFGLHAVLTGHRHKLTGILNGVDHDVWNPATDEHLPAQGGANYSVADQSGKQACKQALFQRFGFPPSRVHRPLFGCISRMVTQKGIDLIRDSLRDIVRQDAYVVFLGSGPEHDALAAEVARLHHRAAIASGYDEPLSHLIEAGCDFYLMPSRYEPCGLNQMYSLAYGTLPIVRRTGGLADTVTDLGQHPDTGTGFLFDACDRDALLGAVMRALNAWQYERNFGRLRARAMTQDFSWNRAAESYAAIYQELVAARIRSSRSGW